MRTGMHTRTCSAYLFELSFVLIQLARFRLVKQIAVSVDTVLTTELDSNFVHQL